MQVTTIDRRLLGYAAAICLGGGLACAGGQGPAATGLKILEDAAAGRFTIADGARPVLTYNFGTVPVPAGVTGRYAVARSDYVHPLYGPDGEALTKDYSEDHPHHRGIYWAWPEVTWNGEKRDLHALQGVFARPVRIVRKEVAVDYAVLAAENVWKWGDAEPLVQELVTITVRREKERRRIIDLELRFEALTDGVTLARRDQVHYGGLNVRLSARGEQKIATHTSEPGKTPRQAWACLTGVAPEGRHPVSLVLLQSPANPEYPGDWIQYPELNWLQPAFPSKGRVYSLTRGVPLTLRFRLAVFPGEPAEAMLQRMWNDYSETGK
jgi:hypothetical protein